MSKPDKQGRHHLHIELTPAQYQSLTVQAKRCGLTKRAYLVRIIEGSPVRARPAQEIKELRTEIHAKRGLFLLDQVYELMYQIAKK